MPKTCSHIIFLMFEHLLTPLFQHLGESVPPFLSVKVDQDLDIETLKISMHQKVPPLKVRNIFVSDFNKILCVEPFDHKDFKLSIYIIKKVEKIKFLNEIISNLLIKNVKSSFTRPL